MKKRFSHTMIGLESKRHHFALPVPTWWYLKTLKFALPPTQTLKFALPRTPTLNTIRWKISVVGSQTQIFCVGHVDFRLFVSLSLALASQCEHNFQWNMGYRSMDMKLQCVSTTPNLPHDDICIWSNPTKWTHLVACLQQWGSYYHTFSKISLIDGLYSIT